MYSLDPYLFQFNPSEPENIIFKIEDLVEVAELIELRKLSQKLMFNSEIFEIFMGEYPHTDKSFASNYNYVYDVMRKIVLQCNEVTQFTISNEDQYHLNIYDDLLRSIRIEWIKVLLSEELKTIIMGGEHTPHSSINCVILSKFRQENEVRNFGRFSYNNHSKFLAYFKPSQKHISTKPEKGRASILTRQDEEDCYELINEAIPLDKTSGTLVAYNKRTKNIIKFHLTHGMEYHAFPISEQEYYTYVKPHIEYDILT